MGAERTEGLWARRALRCWGGLIHDSSDHYRSYAVISEVGGLANIVAMTFGIALLSLIVQGEILQGYLKKVTL
jgi:hypothetical protein